MRQLAWVLLGALMATAMGQVNQAAIAELASEPSDPPAEPATVEAEPPASHKTAQGILQAVEAVVASLTPDTLTGETVVKSEEPAKATEPDTTNGEGAPPPSGAETSAEAAEGESGAQGSEATPEASVAEPESPVQPEEDTVVDVDETEPEKEKTPTKKEQKLIAKHNEIVDKVLVILEKRMKAIGPLPITLNEESLLALDQEVEPETEAPVETPKGSTEQSGDKGKNKVRKNKNKRNKNKKNRNKNNRNRKNSEDQEAQKTKRKNNSNEKNDNKNNNNRSNEKGNKNNNSGEKKKNKKNKNRRNKSKNNPNKRKRNPKALNIDEDEDEDDTQVDITKQSRRKDSEPTSVRINKRRANKNNRKNNRKNNKKNNKKTRKNKNKGRSDIESRQETGPVHPTQEEKAAANGRLAGVAKVTRNGDVEVNVKEKKSQVKAMVTIGPLSANLKDKTRAISKAEVTTSLNAEITFKVKSVSRRNKINVSGVKISALTPEDVAVTRADLELDPADVTPVQQQVSEAIDVSRVSSIINKELEDIFNEDNIVENLESHTFLQN